MAYGRYSIHTVLNHLKITKFKQNNWHSSDGAEIYYDLYDCGSHFKGRSLLICVNTVKLIQKQNYVDPDEIKEIDGNDGIEFTYIDCNSNPALIISHPDPEYYSQEVDEIFISNCPWCGRDLK